jgi:phosphoserine phosphatase
MNASNLIIQGNDLTLTDIHQIAKLVKSKEINQLNQQAFKLLEVDRQAGIADLCAEKRLDYAFMPANARLADIGLLAMDMDSTLITIECIDEIADMAGIKAPISAITERAMQGALEFKQSLQERVALLAGLPAEMLQTVYETRLQLNRGAEHLFNVLHENNIYTLLISGGFTYFSDRLKSHLQLSEAVSNMLEIKEGKLTGKIQGQIVDSHYKAHHVEAVRIKLGLEKKQVVTVGDGANDIPMLQAAGYGIAFRGKPIVQQSAHLAINHVGLDGILHLFR